MVQFGAFGLLVNVILYLVFLWLISVGLTPHLSQFIAFALGTMTAFALNRNYTFTDDKPLGQTLPRYLLLYGGCYILNVILLAALLQFRVPPWLAQAICVFLSAVGLFFAQRSWIFKAS